MLSFYVLINSRVGWGYFWRNRDLGDCRGWKTTAEEFEREREPEYSKKTTKSPKLGLSPWVSVRGEDWDEVRFRPSETKLKNGKGPSPLKLTLVKPIMSLIYFGLRFGSVVFELAEEYLNLTTTVCSADEKINFYSPQCYKFSKIL